MLDASHSGVILPIVALVPIIVPRLPSFLLVPSRLSIPLLPRYPVTPLPTVITDWRGGGGGLVD